MLKTEYRQREIPITNALRERLDRAIQNSNGSYVFSMEGGERFNINSFRKTPWSKALEKAGSAIGTHIPPDTRLQNGVLSAAVHPERLVRLLGHGSKQMVYEVYGKYVAWDLRRIRDRFMEYFGKDFFGL